MCHATHKDNRKQESGFTLLELLTTLGVTAILTLFALPAFSKLYYTIRTDNIVHQLTSLLAYSRISALNHKQMTTLCPTEDHEACGKDWETGIMVFLDYDEDGIRSADEPILTSQTKLMEGATLSWRAFRKKPYLQFTPEGTTNEQNGRFAYCPPNGEREYWRQLIIHKTGRVRKVRERDLKDYC